MDVYLKKILEAEITDESIFPMDSAFPGKQQNKNCDCEHDLEKSDFKIKLKHKKKRRLLLDDPK